VIDFELCGATGIAIALGDGRSDRLERSSGLLRRFLQ
jgi:hypothetical protein